MPSFALWFSKNKIPLAILCIAALAAFAGLILFDPNTLGIRQGLKALFAMLLGFAFGAVPFGLVISLSFCRIDPRKAGSGNIGATNVSRLCGAKYGFATLVCDILKGVFPVLFAMYALKLSMPACSLAGFAALVGHRFPPYLDFKGGKAVATTVGVFMALAFWQLVICAVLCLLVIWRSGFVSLGALVLVCSMPICLAAFSRWDLVPFSLAVAALVIHAHKGNIKRLLAHEEKSWIKKKAE